MDKKGKNRSEITWQKVKASSKSLRDFLKEWTFQKIFYFKSNWWFHKKRSAMLKSELSNLIVVLKMMDGHPMWSLSEYDCYKKENSFLNQFFSLELREYIGNPSTIFDTTIKDYKDKGHNYVCTTIRLANSDFKT